MPSTTESSTVDSDFLPGPDSAGPGPRASYWWFAGGSVLAIATVLVVSLLAGARPYLLLGASDPGTVVAIAAPLLRLLADIAATVCLGALAFAVCCTRPQPSGIVTPIAYGELRVAGPAAAAWAVCSLLLVPLSAADIAGQPLSNVLIPEHFASLLGAVEPPRAWLLSAGVAIVVAVGARMTLRWQPTVLLCALAVGGLLPPVVTTHGSSSIGHDLSIAALVVHMPVAAAWVGTLFALLRNARRGGRAVPELLRSYSRVAPWAWLTLAASGIVLGIVLAGPEHLLDSRYGTLLVVKAALAVLLGAGGVLLRNRALRSLDATGASWRGLARVGLVELGLLLVILGLSVGLTHLPLPGFLGRRPSTTELLLGYHVSEPPTVLLLLTDWRIELLFAPLAIALAAAYLAGVRKLRARGQAWPLGRTAAWLGGCLVLLLATSSGIGRYAAALFSMHQLSHMLVSMLAPALLVLGAPLTLTRAARAEQRERRTPGAGELLERLAQARPLRVLTHPLVALALFAGSPFALYFTGLFDALVRFHWGHMLITGWFLVVGYLFFWPLIGLDRAPRPLPNLARLGVLLAAMPADILFGALLITTDRVIGNGVAASNMYQALALSLPWMQDLHAIQRLGGIIALVVGEVTLFVALAVLLTRWNTVDTEDTESGFGAYRTLVRDARSR